MEKIYIKNPELIEKENEENLILFNVNSGVLVELNKISKILWEKTENSFTLNNLKEIIKENCFNIKESLDQDLKDFINNALKKKLIKIEED